MRDLELRGAGNLLGDEQSGHVAAVGFELYCEMLAEAVEELSGTRLAVSRPVRVDAGVDAYVPPTYVPLEATKIDIHRRIALAGSVDDLRELRVELADRFGPPPEPVENLLLLQEARLKLGRLGGGLRVDPRLARDDRQARPRPLRAAGDPQRDRAARATRQRRVKLG